MPIIIGLAAELDEAATYLETHARDEYRADILFYPRAVNLLRAKAAQLRQPKGKRTVKARTVTAYVGKRRSKGNAVRIKTSRLEE